MSTEAFMKKFAFVFLVAALVVLAAMPLAGQTQTGRLEGVVRDAQNAVIPNAKVTAVHVQTGATSETTTNNQGLYVFAAVGIGTYNVSVEANGFRKLVL
jgi:hypothetical protein